MKQVKISDFLNSNEIENAIKLYKSAPPGQFAKECADKIISPNLTRINSSLGQENDPRYLAYAVECAIMFGGKQ